MTALQVAVVFNKTDCVRAIVAAVQELAEEEAAAAAGACLSQRHGRATSVAFAFTFTLTPRVFVTVTLVYVTTCGCSGSCCQGQWRGCLSGSVQKRE
jgi:hypothetical protein